MLQLQEDFLPTEGNSVNYENHYYDFHYEETASDVWENCVLLSFKSVWPVIKYLLSINILFGLLTSSGFLNQSMFHIISGCIGIYLLSLLEFTSGKILLIVYFVFSYILLYLSLYFQKFVKHSMFVCVIFIISLTLSEYVLIEEVVWQEIRGVVMILAMKLVSLADEMKETKSVINIVPYFGYVLCGSNVLFGPWISYNDYKNLYFNSKKKNIFWILSVLRAFVLSLVFLMLSNCWSTYFIPAHSNRWLITYREAFSVRTSHYFISYLAEAGMIAAGFTNPTSRFWSYAIVKPMDIELPSSLSVVVTSWNIPMHIFLKKYVYRPLLPYGPFFAILGTFIVSSFLHGFEVKVSVVLISLGLFSYLQIVPRNILSRLFNSCLKVKPCKNCTHKYKRSNFVVKCICISYSFATVLHLAYLGILMDTSTNEVGIYAKWKHLYFISHIIMLLNCIFLFF